MAKVVSKGINCILIIFMLLIVGIVWFGTGTDYAYKKIFLLPNVIFALVGVLSLGFISLGTFKLGDLLEKSKKDNIVMFMASGLLFCGLALLTYHYYFKTGWDSQMVEAAAKAISEKDWENVQNKYFSYYPNNVFLTWIFSHVIRMGKVFGITNHYFCIVFFQCFLFTITGFLIYQIAKQLASIQVGFTVWVIYVALIGLSPWVVIPYSDATGIVFPTLILYLYVSACGGKKVELLTFCMSLACYIGYKIKPQIAIVGIAIVLVTLASFHKGWLFQKEKLLRIFFCGVAGLCFGSVIVAYGTKATHLEIDEELAFGLPHYIMMGVNEEYGGVINIVDQNFSMSFNDAKERTDANLQVAAERIEELGVVGVLSLWRDKTLTNFADGTFAWWQEGNFIIQEMYEGNSRLRDLLGAYFYENGAFHEIFKSSMQLLWMGTLFSVVISLFCGRRNETYCRERDVLKLSVIGLIIFETIFEARARYIFIYAPFFILLIYSYKLRGKNK